MIFSTRDVGSHVRLTWCLIQRELCWSWEPQPEQLLPHPPVRCERDSIPSASGSPAVKHIQCKVCEQNKETELENFRVLDLHTIKRHDNSIIHIWCYICFLDQVDVYVVMNRPPWVRWPELLLPFCVYCSNWGLVSAALHSHLQRQRAKLVSEIEWERGGVHWLSASPKRTPAASPNWL